MRRGQAGRRGRHPVRRGAPLELPERPEGRERGNEWREGVYSLLGQRKLPLHINGIEIRGDPDEFYWKQERGENIQSLFTLFTDKVQGYHTIAHKYLLVAQEVLRHRTIQKSLPYYEKLFRSKLSAENFDKLINPSTSAISGGMRGGGSVKTPLDKLTLDQLGHLLTLSEGNNDKLLIKLNDKLNNAEVNHNSVYDTPLNSKKLVRTHTQSKRESYLPEFSKLDTNNTGLISKKKLLQYTIKAKQNRDEWAVWTSIWGFNDDFSLTNFWENREFQKRWIILTSNNRDEIDEDTWNLWKSTSTDDLKTIMENNFLQNPIGYILNELVIEDGIDFHDQNTSRNPLYLLTDLVETDDKDDKDERYMDTIVETGEEETDIGEMDEEETDIDDMGGISGGNMETRSKRRKIETSDGSLTEVPSKVDESSDILNEMIIELDTMKKDINNELVNNERIKIINNIFNPNIRREAFIRRKAFIRARGRISSMKGRLPYKKKKSTKKRRKPRRKQRRKPCRTVRECKKKMSIIKNKLKKLTKKKKKGSRKKNK